MAVLIKRDNNISGCPFQFYVLSSTKAHKFVSDRISANISYPHMKWSNSLLLAFLKNQVGGMLWSTWLKLKLVKGVQLLSTWKNSLVSKHSFVPSPILSSQLEYMKCGKLFASLTWHSRLCKACKSLKCSFHIGIKSLWHHRLIIPWFSRRQGFPCFISVTLLSSPKFLFNHM